LAVHAYNRHERFPERATSPNAGLLNRFADKLRAAWREQDSLLCVGLDPDVKRMPAPLRDRSDAIFAFCRAIVDATADLACAFKPQIAYFAAERAEDALERLMRYIGEHHPHAVRILDAKRGDIGSTAEQYAREAFERYDADAVTVNPYMGGDSLAPFTHYADRGVIVLCRTSNRGGSDLQFLQIDGEPLYRRVARAAARDWNSHGNMGLVVGATFPKELAEVRAVVGDMPLLVPGIGAQGGDVAATVQAGRTAQGTGLVVNSARAILYASDGDDFAARARAAAIATRDEINRYRSLSAS
jgi:orotidine-5'-phosphate decarboxylase